MADPPAPALAQPLAATLQGDVEVTDLGLLAGARLRHDRIRWWWGQRIIDGSNGAYCYLCDRLIVTWQRSRPITLQAIAAILEHRSWEHRRIPANLGNRTPAMSAGAEAPPVGGPE